jgi:malonyl-ACP decarboxylase
MSEKIVITGMGVVCSIGGSIEEFRAALEAGRSGVGFIQQDSASAGPVNIGAMLKNFSFEQRLPALAGLPSPVLERARRSAQRAPLPIQCSVLGALQAWKEARLGEAPIDPERIGIVVAAEGAMQRFHFDAFAKYGKGPEYLSPRYVLHGLETDHVGTLSEVLQLHGEGFTVGGASASGNVAILKAAQLLQLGLLDACVVVGALCDLSPVALQGFFNVGAMGGRRFRDSPELACRPFDQEHEGFIYGQGSGCLILETAGSAKGRGVPGKAELLGGALRLDGNRLADPNEAGEIRVMQQCMARANLRPEQVDYINAHGSASPLGDETEVRAIKAVLGEQTPRVWINSTKGLTGHCLFSAGVIEAIACVTQMEHGFVHPNLNLRQPIDTVCRFSGPVAERVRIQVALSNSFGFGGINSCIAFGTRGPGDV